MYINRPAIMTALNKPTIVMYMQAEEQHPQC